MPVVPALVSLGVECEYEVLGRGRICEDGWGDVSRIIAGCFLFVESHARPSGLVFQAPRRKFCRYWRAYTDAALASYDLRAAYIGLLPF